MQVFVISLKDAAERQQSIKQNFAKWSIEYELVDAVRGSIIDREKDPRVFNGDSYTLQNNFLSKVTMVGRLNDGEVGCSLSHLKVYEEICKRQLPNAIVCEDDFVPNCDFVKVIESFVNIHPAAQFIHPCTHFHHGVRQGFFNARYKVLIDDKQYKFVRAGIPHLDWFFNRRRRISNTTCYYISRDAAEHLLKIGYPVRMEADRLTGMLAFNKLKSYIVTPVLGDILPGKSYIGEASARHQKAI